MRSEGLLCTYILPAIFLLVFSGSPFASSHRCPPRVFASGPSGEPVYQEYLGMEFVLIPPGTFTMGSPRDEHRRDSDEVLHKVTLTEAFYMQTTEVTQAQWETVMGDNPSHFDSCDANCPVETVSWLDVQEFIARLNARAGGIWYRLPTEAEWEYACRAGTTTAFHSGGMAKENRESGYNDALDGVAWYHRNSANRTHQVGKKMPNAWGLYDMHGNVWEWCSDWAGPQTERALIDPTGPRDGYVRVRRGGSWSHYPMFCRSGNRSWMGPSDSAADVGLRLVREFQAPGPGRSGAQDLKEGPCRPCKFCNPCRSGPGPVGEAGKVPGPCEVRVTEGNMLYVCTGIPNAVNRPGAIIVRKSVPAAVSVGEEFQYTIAVHNRSTCSIKQVTLTERLAEDYRVVGTKPEADLGPEGTLQWVIGPLQPQASEEFVITGIATGSGELENCSLVECGQEICSVVHAVPAREDGDNSHGNGGQRDH